MLAFGDVLRNEALCYLAIRNKPRLFSEKFLPGFDWTAGTASLHKIQHKKNYQYRGKGYVYDERDDGTDAFIKGTEESVPREKFR